MALTAASAWRPLHEGVDDHSVKVKHNVVTRVLSAEAAKTLVYAFIFSRLDYCNSLLFDISDNLLRRLQAIQKAAARLIKLLRHCHTRMHCARTIPRSCRGHRKVTAAMYPRTCVHVLSCIAAVIAHAMHPTMAVALLVLDVTPILDLRQLHWLPVRQCIECKLAVFVYKALNSLSPQYLDDNCHLTRNSGR